MKCNICGREVDPGDIEIIGYSIFLKCNNCKELISEDKSDVSNIYFKHLNED